MKKEIKEKKLNAYIVKKVANGYLISKEFSPNDKDIFVAYHLEDVKGILKSLME